MDGNVVGGVWVTLDCSVMLATRCRQFTLEVVEVNISESDLRAPRAIRLDLVDGNGALSVRMKGFTGSVCTEEHKAIFLLAVRGLASRYIRVVIFTVNLDISH